MKNVLVLIIIVSMLPFVSSAQDAGGGAQSKHKHKAQKAVKKNHPPSWAAAHNYDAMSHVYFPDYYTYYDPNRGGYVFWEKGQWTFTPTVPLFLEKVDLTKSRVQILKGLSLDLHPELDYPHYMELYPAEHDNNLVPVPIPGTPGN